MTGSHVAGPGSQDRRTAFGQGLVSLVRRKPLGAMGAVILLAVVGVAFLAPVISPFDPYQINPEARFAPPNRQMLLGGDQIGRDILSRLIYGARISLYVGIASVAIGITLGAAVGIISAYLGGSVDLICQRFIDALMPFPPIILGLAVMAVLGSSINNVILALIIVLIPGAARTLRAQTLGSVEMDYVRAARAIGCSGSRIVWRHVLPNIVATYIVLCTLMLGYAIVVEASLSFLGVGAPPDVPSWGGMASSAALEGVYTGRGPWLALFPGLAISLVVFGFNLLGDALRDLLDPRLRG